MPMLTRTRIRTNRSRSRRPRTTAMDDFIWRALLGGLGLAAVAGPLGSFVVWRRMAFFGDALAHSALLGIALGFLFRVNLTAGVVGVCVLLALLLTVLQGRTRLAGDTILGIFAHSSLAFGLVVVSFMDRLRVDLISFLFGDILAVTPLDLAWIYGAGIVVLGVLAWLWRPLLNLTVHEDLARVEGVPADRVRLAFVLLMAIVVAIAMKIVGVLLITALLIIPAAAARNFARSPEQMAVLAALAGALAVTAGLAASLVLDTPSGPSIVAASAILFALSLAGRRSAAA
jgi:zinc transport system permease protein